VELRKIIITKINKRKKAKGIGRASTELHKLAHTSYFRL